MKPDSYLQMKIPNSSVGEKVYEAFLLYAGSISLDEIEQALLRTLPSVPEMDPVDSDTLDNYVADTLGNHYFFPVKNGVVSLFGHHITKKKE